MCYVVCGSRGEGHSLEGEFECWFLVSLFVFCGFPFSVSCSGGVLRLLHQHSIVYVPGLDIVLLLVDCIGMIVVCRRVF